MAVGVVGVVVAVAVDESSPVGSTSEDRAAGRSAAMPDLRFRPYQEQEPYRSSEFLNSSIEDKVMEAVYAGVNWFIGRIGKPFPHEGDCSVFSFGRRGTKGVRVKLRRVAK